MKLTTGLERVLGAYTAALVTHAAFPALRAGQVGCLLGWAHLALEAGQAALPRDDLASHSTYFAGLDEAGFEQLLAELKAMRLIAVKDDGAVELVQLAAAMNIKGAETERRKAGWEKRRQAVVVVAPATPAPARPAAAPAVPVAPQAASQDSLLGFELVPAPAPAPKKASVVPKTPSAASSLRIGAGDGDDSPVMVRMATKGGEAEFTDQFVKSMEALFPGVDVFREMRLAAQWCQDKPERRKTLKGVRSFVTSWLSRTSQRREVTMAVVAAGNQRNGFGQGGSYGAGSSSSSSSDLDGLDDLLDFSDIAGPTTPVVESTRYGATTARHA